MNPARWAELKTLFQGALDQPAHARAAWLRAQAHDPDLLREAEALLRAHEEAGEFLERPSQIGSYRLIEELGRGGMGVVYLAEDARLGRKVALKVLPRSLAGNASLRDRLRREARAAATIAHPGVAVVYALEELDDQLLLVTEYVPGRTLRQEMAAGPLAADRAAAIAREILGALGAAHDAGVIHRDLKPENIMVTPGGAVKVVDFGIAYVEGAGGTRHTAEGALLGTPAYMAPEQLAGARGDARADLYAAGVVLSEMLSGRHPLHPDAGVALPPALAPVIGRALTTDPQQRFESARDMLRALNRAAAGEAPRTHARWWWELHQGIVALVYWLMVIPAWTARGLIGGAAGRVFFIAMLASVIVAANLRLHLWFTSRFYPGELPWLRGRVTRWIHAADWIFATALIAGGLRLENVRSPLAVLLLSFGIGAAVAFLVIEAATTRASFHGEPRP